MDKQALIEKVKAVVSAKTTKLKKMKNGINIFRDTFKKASAFEDIITSLEPKIDPEEIKKIIHIYINTSGNFDFQITD